MKSEAQGLVEPDKSPKIPAPNSQQGGRVWLSSSPQASAPPACVHVARVTRSAPRAGSAVLWDALGMEEALTFLGGEALKIFGVTKIQRMLNPPPEAMTLWK